MTNEQQAKLDKLVNDLAADVKADVERIEAKPETTQHHYGDYGALLSTVSGGRKNVAFIVAKALIKAGAHPVGVQNGLKLFT